MVMKLNIKKECCRFVKRGRYSQSQFTAFNSIPPNYNVSRTG
jgi:hypothetical protein